MGFGRVAHLSTAAGNVNTLYGDIALDKWTGNGVVLLQLSRNMDYRTLAKIRRQGYRVTQPRKAILAFLKKQSVPCTAQQVVTVVHDRGVDRSTVFRTLKLLAAEGLLQMTENTQNERLYELTTRPHHHHLQCERCGGIKEIRCAVTAATLQGWARRYGFQAIRHVGDVYGLCRVCASTRKTHVP